MEARGRFDFCATAEDELSFRKGDILKIIGSQDEWLKAELHGHEGFVPKNYVDRQVPRWFRGNASRSSAEEMLMSQEVGSFLIRSSQNSPGDFSISVRHEADVQHFKVMKDGRGHYYLWSERFTSFNKLVEFYKTTSISKQREIFLRDGGPGDARVLPSYPTKKDNRPQASTHRRASEQTHTQQNKQGSLEERTPSMSSAGRNSPVGSAPSAPRRSSDNTPAPKPYTQVKALYDFIAEEKDELGFSAGDIIEVLDQSDVWWWSGRLRGNVGLFPANYITET